MASCNLRNFCIFALLISIVQLSLARTQFDLPIARIYQVEDNNRLRPWKRIDSNFETTIQDVENLRLDCVANYPVQWIYTGNGIPEYTSSNKYSRKNSHGETSSEFIATILINPLKEHHTGRYQCSPAEYIDGRAFFYIFVPGQNLFTSVTGHNIMLPKNDTSITIPCTVSNPNAAVNLEKSDGGVLRRIRVRASDAVVYDPKVGFTVKLNKIESPEGTYVCTARHGSYVRSVEYTVSTSYANYQSDQPSNLQNKCKKPCGENAFCDIVDGRETCACLPEFNGDPDLKCVIKCNAHTDCPSTMSCFVDRQCRSPCVHSAHGCGINAKCKVENHRPVCYCPKDWLGDETVQCFNSLQGSEPSRPDSSDRGQGQGQDRDPRPGSGVKCGSNTDCPSNTTCIRLSASSPGKECVDPCRTRRCGRNAQCIVEERRSSCECLPGFSGDARIECGPNKLNKNQFSEPLIQGDSGDYYGDLERDRATAKEVYLKRRCTQPEMCGQNAVCRLDKSGNQQCFCSEGFMGQPPKCRPECRENKDCPQNHACVTDKRVGYPSCTKTCGSRVCGAHADCAQFEDGSFECYCPDGLYGDPLVKCETKEMRLGRDCSTDYDCGIQLRCEIGADDRKCVDPCDKKRCPSEFVCHAEDHYAKCVCPPGFTGNEYVGCNKDAVLDKALAPCANISCGSNSECRVVGGKPICFCQSGYLGKPPVCIAECLSNSDCPSDLSCISRRCRHRCSGCGKNTRCRVAPNLERNSVCTCLDGFEGNPYVECRPYV